jgi:putative ABC transport system permease protein
MNSLTLVRKSLLRKKLRFTLLHVVVLVAFLLFGLLASVQHYMSGASLAGAGQRLIVANAINITRPVPYRYVAEVRALPGVAEASELSWFGGYYRESKNFLASYAVDPQRLLRLYPELGLGQAQRASFVGERRGILVGRATAAKYGWTEGQRVSLTSSIFSNTDGGRNWDFVISGIFTNSKPGGDEQSVYLRYDYFNDSRAQGRDQIGSIVLAPTQAGQAEALARSIDAHFQNSSAATSTMSEAQFSRAFLAQFGDIAMVVNIVVGTGLVTMLLVLGNTLMMNVRARTREIAVLKALGFSQRRILGLVGGEALSLVGSGALVGLVLASALMAVLRHIPSFSSLVMPPSVWLAGAAAALVIGTLCAAPPALRALRINVAAGLRKE